jgi:hypothetical protein
VDLIEHQLAHAVRDANGRAYNRTAHLEARKKMMQHWADYLDELRQNAEKTNSALSARPNGSSPLTPTSAMDAEGREEARIQRSRP